MPVIKEITIRGTYPRESTSYYAMLQRCLNKNCKAYHHYGERGINICDRWKQSFWNFLEDMGEMPVSKSSLDRIDVNGDYCPENCRWADWKEQLNNKTDNHFITYNETTKTLEEWSKEFGIKANTICYRLKRGWSTDEAFEIKIKTKKKYIGRLNEHEISMIINEINNGKTRRSLSKLLNIDESQISRIYNKFKNQ